MTFTPPQGDPPPRPAPAVSLRPGPAYRITCGGEGFAFRGDPDEPAEYSSECVDCGLAHTVDGRPVQHLLWMARHAADTGHTDYSTVEARFVVVTPEGPHRE